MSDVCVLVGTFGCQEDLSHEPPDALLPGAVATGKEPFLTIVAMARGVPLNK